MRQPGSIVLISCYELGHQPLGLASPLGFLERGGFAPAALDIARGEFDERLVGGAEFVGISVPMHTALRLGARVAQRVRDINPRCHICFYGLYATLNADYLLDNDADSIVGGEYEVALVSLVEALAAGLPWEAVEGIVSRSSTDGNVRSDRIQIYPSSPDLANGGMGEAERQVETLDNRERPFEPAKRVSGGHQPVLRRLDFTLPSRSGLPRLEHYARLQRNGHQGLVGYVEASRGCLHLCLHCPIPSVYGGRFFVVPQEIVLADIRNLVRAGAEHITFGDPDFLNGPRHSLGIVRALHHEFPDLTFDFTAKVEHILKHAGLMPELAELGCVFAVSAVESLSDTVLANLEKGHTRADVFRTLEILRSAGIPLRPSLVSFTPWTTLDDYLDVLDFVETEGLIDQVDPVHYTIRLLVPPGSGLLSRPAIHRDLIGLDQATLTYRWTHPDPRLDRLYKAVSALVEQTSRDGEDSALTFGRVQDLAFRMHEHRRPARESCPLPPDRQRPPRLTEPWFC
jgi:radical SAM superfamily enzyme YgiQ (UPF0313 family)